MIPGSNILNTALSVIAKSPFNYYAFSTKTVQSNGQYLNNYAAPQALLGSVQPVPRSLYQEYGLDFDKFYQKFFVSQDVIDVSRDVSGDLIQFQGNMYQCQSVTPWYGIDGWVEVLTIQVVNIPLITAVTGPAAGTYDTDAMLTFTVNYNMAVSVSGTPVIILAPITGIIGGNASYSAGTGTDTLTFTYTVASGDTAAGITASSPISGSIISAADGSSIIPANSSFVPPSMTGVILN